MEAQVEFCKTLLGLGDSYSTWPSFAFQPRFTSTAANVGYGYWSHDIGGHLAPNMLGDSYKDPNFKARPLEPELYTRWVQFGAFSPILRTHSTKDPILERRLWAYPDAHARAMREAVHLRYSLLPYLYTAARQAYDTGLSMLRPMYYDWPEAEEAYRFADQSLGDDLDRRANRRSCRCRHGLGSEGGLVAPGRVGGLVLG